MKVMFRWTKILRNTWIKSKHTKLKIILSWRSISNLLKFQYVRRCSKQWSNRQVTKVEKSREEITSAMKETKNSTACHPDVMLWDICSKPPKITLCTDLYTYYSRGDMGNLIPYDWKEKKGMNYGPIILLLYALR